MENSELKVFNGRVVVLGRSDPSLGRTRVLTFWGQGRTFWGHRVTFRGQVLTFRGQGESVDLEVVTSDLVQFDGFFL